MPKRIEWDALTGRTVQCGLCNYTVTLVGHQDDDNATMRAHGVLEHDKDTPVIV